MNTTLRWFGLSCMAASLLITDALTPGAIAQPANTIAAGRTVLTFVNRLVVNPPKVLVVGYFPTIEGLPGALFSGAPSENTAYFTWSLNAAGASQFSNGDSMAPGGTSVVVLRSGEDLNVYFNSNPNQSWTNLASFSAGQLVATFKSTTGTEIGSGAVALVTQSYILSSSEDFSFNGQTYNFARLLPHGFTFMTMSSNVPYQNTTPPTFPMIFTAAGSAIAIGGPYSALPRWF